MQGQTGGICDSSSFVFGSAMREYLFHTKTHNPECWTLEPVEECGILFICCLPCKYVHLEYVRVHVICRVHQAEYVIHLLVVAPQEYVEISG